MSFPRHRADPGPHTGTWSFRWPAALAEVLRGPATLVVRDAVSGATTGPVEVRFSDDPEPLDLTSASGRWMSVNKWGRLAASFDGMEPAPRRAVQDLLLADLGRLAADLAEVGLRPFVAYGTLLGLRRDGDLIPHDDDADLAYLSGATDPVDVVHESYRVSRALERAATTSSGTAEATCRCGSGPARRPATWTSSPPSAWGPPPTCASRSAPTAWTCPS